MEITKISKKQLRVLSWWYSGKRDSKYDGIICDGAVRSGKTLFMGLSFVLWAMANYNGMQFGICGKTIISLRRNVVNVILPQLEMLGYGYKQSISKNQIEIFEGKRHNTFHLFGGKDEGSAALIQGVTLAGVLFDEAALQPRSFVEQACARCSVEGSRFWFNCNPEGPNHWFYQEWILKAKKRNLLYLHFTMEDNPSLSDRIRKRYENMYTGAFYKRFILGQWVTAQGRVYDFFDDSFVEPVPEGEFEKFYVSCDYGTYNPASFGLWGKMQDRWYRIDEYYYQARIEGRQKTDEEYADDLEKLIRGRKIEAIIVDPSASSFIVTLARRGFRVVKAKNDVLYGIRSTSDHLKKRDVVICDTCKDAIREFSLYSWDEKSADGDTPKKVNDHAMDEIRYFVVAAFMESSYITEASSVERKLR